jgi:transcriptional regulator with XRE-family HTH domain
MGRKPGISRSEKLLRAKLADALRVAIGSKRGAQARAAKRLGVSAQTVSLYLRQKATPGTEILRRVCAAFKLSLDVEGATLDSNSFEAPLKREAKPMQMSIFEAISDFDDQQLNVTVLRKRARSIDLKVSIDFRNIGSRR